ncbi:MAG: L,D-transpeptidase family protein [Oliverpabstia sp.]
MAGKTKKKRKSFWRIAIGVSVILILLLAVAAAYIWRAGYFANHFYKGTWINGIDCSYLTTGQVKELLQERVNEYQLTITTQEGEEYVVTGPQFHLTYVDDNRVNELMLEQEPLKWIQKAFKGGKYEVSANTTYEESSVEPILKSLPFMKEENIVVPQDAYMQETDQGYSIVPEVVGNALDEEKVIGLVKEAVSNGTESISLVENECYLKPAVYQDNEALVNEVNTLNALTSANLTYNVCDEVTTIDRNLLKSWLIQDEQGNYSIDQSMIDAFINELADKRDTYGGTRKFTTHAGNEISLKTNKYGWKVNREDSIAELTAAINEGRQGEIELVFSQKAQGTGANDLGSVYVEISIKDQMMWCYKDGKVIVETPVVTGTETDPKRATPRNGCWTIYRKKTEYTMKGPLLENGEYEYTAFVHYWMPFNGGVGIHDLASRGNNFGGDIYMTNGSHGCINTPLAAAKTIYDTVSVGTPVIVY